MFCAAAAAPPAEDGVWLPPIPTPPPPLLPPPPAVCDGIGVDAGVTLGVQGDVDDGGLLI